MYRAHAREERDTNKISRRGFIQVAGGGDRRRGHLERDPPVCCGGSAAGSGPSTLAWSIPTRHEPRRQRELSSRDHHPLVKNRAPLVQTPCHPLARSRGHADGAWLLHSAAAARLRPTAQRRGAVYAELGQAMPHGSAASRRPLAPSLRLGTPRLATLKGLVAARLPLNDPELIAKGTAVDRPGRSQPDLRRLRSLVNIFGLGGRDMPMLTQLKMFHEATTIRA